MLLPDEKLHGICVRRAQSQPIDDNFLVYLRWDEHDTIELQ